MESSHIIVATTQVQRDAIAQLFRHARQHPQSWDRNPEDQFGLDS